MPDMAFRAVCFVRAIVLFNFSTLQSRHDIDPRVPALTTRAPRESVPGLLAQTFRLTHGTETDSSPDPDPDADPSSSERTRFLSELCGAANVGSSMQALIASIGARHL